MSFRIAVLDYGIGNLASVAKGLASIGADVRLVTSASEVKRFAGVVLPGVGSFGSCARALRNRGFHETIYSSIEGSVPILGVCVGLQLLYEGSDECPNDPGLGIFAGRIHRIESGGLRIPQMQWNQLAFTPLGSNSPLFKGIDSEPWMYFVHSYAASPGPETLAVATYGESFAAAVGTDNLFATQFHPEKSSRAGLTILENFLGIVKAS